MAVTYHCAGRERGVCDHEAPEPWRGRCPSCGRLYNCVSGGRAPKEMKSTASLADAREPPRIKTGIAQLDRVLGGGLVRGSTVLFGGDEGTGKSSLLVLASDGVAQGDRTVLYATGEQSLDDIGIISRRVGVANPRVFPLGMMANIVEIVGEAEERKPTLLVVDSAQTSYHPDVEGADVGSDEQGRAVINYVTSATKTINKFATVVVNHFNKSGDFAGKKANLHLVDTLLRLEHHPAAPRPGEPLGDGDDDYAGVRVLSVGKNRNGPENLYELFRMGERGPEPFSERLRLVDD